MTAKLVANLLFILILILASNRGFSLELEVVEIEQICKMLDEDCSEASREVLTSEEDFENAKKRGYEVIHFTNVANEAAAKLNGCNKLKEELCD